MPSVCTAAWRQRRWPVVELWCFPPFIVCDSLAHALCLYSEVWLTVHSWSGSSAKKQLERCFCFICLSGSDVPPPGDAKHWLGFNPSPLCPASSFFFLGCTWAGDVHTACLRCPPQSLLRLHSLNWAADKLSYATELCPQPLLPDLELKWSRLNGRVH